jgi:hypothetical protein
LALARQLILILIVGLNETVPWQSGDQAKLKNAELGLILDEAICM